MKDVNPNKTQIMTQILGIRLLRTLVKSSRIYTGQYTFQILLLNDDKMLGEHKGG